MSWYHLLQSISESANDHLRLRNAYLAAENRILRRQIQGRVKPAQHLLYASGALSRSEENALYGFKTGFLGFYPLICRKNPTILAHHWRKESFEQV